VSFIPAQYNTTVYQVAQDTPDANIAWAVAFTLTDTNGDPLDLTGYAAEFVVGPPVNLTLSTPSAQLVIEGLSGEVSVSLTVLQVNAVFPGARPGYFLQLTDSLGNTGVAVNGVMYWSASNPGGLGY
jgi:hypothetical protein